MRKRMGTMVRFAVGFAFAAGLAGCEDDGGGGSDGLHAQAAAGQPIAQAAAYKTANPSPLILVYQQDPDPNVIDEYHPTWEDKLPATWVANRASELELVCYFGPETTVVVGSKTYTEYIGNSPLRNMVVERHRRQLPVLLKEAQTGQTVAQTTLQGSMPRDFRETETQYNIYGNRPELVDLQAWLAPYVEP